MRRVIAGLLVVILVVVGLMSLTACGGGSSLVGTWERRYTSPLTGITVIQRMEFGSDGSFASKTHNRGPYWFVDRGSWSSQDNYFTTTDSRGNSHVREYEITGSGNNRVLRWRRVDSSVWETWTRVR